ncbi:MAG: hypothetical protein QOD00_4220 [Blastocatellia bacterium]|jgi:hypothetical protein|nr:hypothetical protein [Blastocatellia bacterium]
MLPTGVFYLDLAPLIMSGMLRGMSMPHVAHAHAVRMRLGGGCFRPAHLLGLSGRGGLGLCRMLEGTCAAIRPVHALTTRH